MLFTTEYASSCPPETGLAASRLCLQVSIYNSVSKGISVQIAARAAISSGAGAKATLKAASSSYEHTCFVIVFSRRMWRQLLSCTACMVARAEHATLAFFPELAEMHVDTTTKIFACSCTGYYLLEVSMSWHNADSIVLSPHALSVSFRAILARNTNALANGIPHIFILA